MTSTARRMVARGASRLPIDVADQLDAAGHQTRALHDRMGAVLPLLVPDRRWYQRTAPEPSDETRALLLASLLACTMACVHIRRAGPRPAIARLPLGRVDCERCAATLYRPVTGDDQCDVCWRPEVLTFTPFACRFGPLVLAGDACPSCVDTLGIRVEEAS